MTIYLYEPDSFTPLARLEQTLEEPAHVTLGPDGEFTEHPVKTTHATYFYQNDHLGTPQELVDEEGEIVWLGKYRAWGELRSATQQNGQPSQIRNALRFQGQYCDDETGLHYNLNRYYDPASGRFINEDPIGLAGGINLFKYAPNPVQWIDPTGLAKCRPCPDKCDKILGEAGIQVGSHRDMQKAAGGLYDSHHVYQDAAVNSLPGYGYYDAPAVVLQGRNEDGTTRGTPHYQANRTQDQRGGGNLAAERRIAYKAIRNAGLTPEQTRCTLMKADQYFSEIGASGTSTTTIPKRRK